jgi:hypothetical protein
MEIQENNGGHDSDTILYLRFGRKEGIGGTTGSGDCCGSISDSLFAHKTCSGIGSKAVLLMITTSPQVKKWQSVLRELKEFRGCDIQESTSATIERTEWAIG